MAETCSAVPRSLQIVGERLVDDADARLADALDEIDDGEEEHEPADMPVILRRSRGRAGCQAKTQGKIASPSISTLACGSIRAETWTRVMAGKCLPRVLPQAAPIAAPAALNSAMSVT